MATKLKDFVEAYLSECDRSRQAFRAVGNALKSATIREPKVWDTIPVWCAAREKLHLSVDLYDVEQAVLHYREQQHDDSLRH